MTTADSIHDEHDESSHEPPSYDDINTPVVVLVGAISALVTLLTIMFVQGMCYHWQNSYIKERSTDAVSMPANQQIETQKAVLAGGEGVVPIDEAMKKIVAKYGK
jgi:hypothetical protein